MTKIVILGEAWGEAEERQRQPFVGPAGYELTKMLSEAGIHRADCFLTNVFNVRPRPTNDIENLCTGKDGGYTQLGPLRAGKYPLLKYAPEFERLERELREIKPNLTVALGNTAAWFLTGSSGISKVRGTVTLDRFGRKCLPTYHPAAVLRQWDLRAVTVLDLCKAARESEFPEIRRPERLVYLDPSLEDLEWFFHEHLASASRISFDIETAGRQITCIGFAPSASVALVIPFSDPRKPGGSYWPDLASEVRAWDYVRRVLALPCPKVGQNTLYDINFLWVGYGIPVVNYEDDTMLLHHSLQPESEKGLGFLASVYTNESSWKMMRSKEKKTIKRED